jgi:hypothetical protein
VYSAHTRSGAGLSGLLNPGLDPNYDHSQFNFDTVETVTTASAWTQPHAFGGPFDGTNYFDLQIWLYGETDLLGCGVNFTHDPSQSFFEAFTGTSDTFITFDSSVFAGQWFHLTATAAGTVALTAESGALIASHTFSSGLPNAKAIELAIIGRQFVGASAYIDDLSWSAAPPVIRKFPRDDGLGLSSASRIFPPPKSGRIVGGYQ